MLLAICLILGLLLLVTPSTLHMSFTPHTESALQTATSSDSSSPSDPITPMQFEIVKTQAAQERGLGGRADVPENYGMLFVFSEAKPVGFWMKDMLVPIDIIWLSDTGTILGIEDSISPNTYPKIVYPPQPVKLVLETRAGEARRRGWAVGTQVSLPQQ